MCVCVCVCVHVSLCVCVCMCVCVCAGAAGAGVRGEGGDHGRRLRSGRAQRHHHEPPHASGLDVPMVLSAALQLPASGEDLPQSGAQGRARLRSVHTLINNRTAPGRA